MCRILSLRVLFTFLVQIKPTTKSMAGADLAFAIAQHLQVRASEHFALFSNIPSLYKKILADQARLRGGTGVPDAESLDGWFFFSHPF